MLARHDSSELWTEERGDCRVEGKVIDTMPLSGEHSSSAVGDCVFKLFCPFEDL